MRAALPLWLLTVACFSGLGLSAEPPTVPPLPEGAYAEWNPASAWHSESATRASLSLNGLWRFRSAQAPQADAALNETYTRPEDLRWQLDPKKAQVCRSSLDLGQAASGGPAWRLDLNLPAQENFFHLTHEVPVKPETAYRLVMRLRSQLASGYLNLELQDPRNRFDGPNKKIHLVVSAPEKITGQSDWRNLEIDFRTPAGMNQARLYLRYYGGREPVQGQVWVKSVVLTESQADSSHLTPPTDAAWGWAKVPGSPKNPDFTTYWPAKDPYTKKADEMSFAWWEREVAIPADWTGRRLVVAFDRVGTNLTLFCNGQKAGECGWFGGEIEIGKLIQPGQTARLTALIEGRKSGETSELFPDTGKKAWQIKPGQCSILGDVRLESTPAGARLGALRIETSVARHQLKVVAELPEPLPAGVTLACTVRDGDKVVKEFSAPVAEKATTTEAVTEWTDPELWEIGRAKLYTLTAALQKDGRNLDQSLPERFGFREFEVRGKFFYLNGVKLNIRPASYRVDATYTLDPAVIDRWLQRATAEGRNFVYCETVDAPNRADGLRAVLEAADAAGVLMAITPAQITGFWQRWDEPKLVAEYAGYLRTRARQVWNHPALIMYRMNMNFCCYNQDQNPLFLDGQKYPPADSALGQRFAALERSNQLMREIDPTRPTYNHACGNAGEIYTLNNYLCWPQTQDLREWLHVWAQQGTKPLMMVEFDLPYPGSMSMNDPSSWWMNEPLMTEHGAQLLGERSYELAQEDMLDFIDLAWNRKTNKWESAYGYYCPALPPILDECSTYYHEITLPAWRTWGISGGMNIWEYSTQRLKKLPEKFSSGWGMRVRPPDLPVATEWAKLQHPGFAPDRFVYDCRGTGEILTYLFPGRPEESEYLEPTKWGQTVPVLYQPLFAWLTGPGEDWPEQDHGFYAGETVRKSVIVLNDLRTPQTFTVKWQAKLAGRVVGEGAGELKIEPAEKAQLNLEFAAPAVTAREAGEIIATVTTAGRDVPVKPFAFQVHPAAAKLPAAPAGWAIYDPVGRTAKALGSSGCTLPAVTGGALPADLKVLIVGSEALDAAQELPAVLRGLGARLDAGLQVVFFEQTAAALEKFFGLRAFDRASRQVCIRDSASPLVQGLTNEDLADWRGRTTLGPLAGAPEDLEENQRYLRAWRCSQRGTVATAIVEKPHLGNFRPIMDGEFDLRYMMLWEVFEGAGRMVFCQLDVSDRLGHDPAADRLAANLMSEAAAWRSPAHPQTYLIADDAGLLGLLPFKLEAQINPVSVPSAEGSLLILGRGCGPWVFANAAAFKQYFASGGRAVALGLEGDEANLLSALLAPALPLEAKTLWRTLPAGALPEAFRGVSPAENSWRERHTVQTVAPTAAGWRTETGNLAAVKIGTGELVWLAAAPGDFDPARRPDLVFTQVNQDRLWALALTNLGAMSRMRWTNFLDRQPGLEGFSLAGVWRARKDEAAQGAAEGWMKPEVDVTGPEWRDLPTPGNWGQAEPKWFGFLGDVWQRFKFKLPEAYAGLPLELYATAIDDTDECWLNGVKIGETTRETPNWWGVQRHYRIPAGLLRPAGEENVLVLRVNNNYMDAGVQDRIELRLPPALTKPAAAQYLDTRTPRDDPYATMRW